MARRLRDGLVQTKCPDELMNPSSPALCPILSQDPDVLMKSVTIYDHIDASVRVGIPSWVARGIFTLLTRDPCGFPAGSRVITIVNILKIAHTGFRGYCHNSQVHYVSLMFNLTEVG